MQVVRTFAIGLQLVGLLTAMIITGCHDDPVENPTPTAEVPAPSSETSAQPVVLKGTPATVVTAGQDYSFKPSVSGTGPIVFSIAGQPAWSHFDASNGALTGTPGPQDVGQSAKITIAASNSTGSSAIAPFVIEVKTPPVDPTAATLSWTPPTENTDGTPATALAGYYVRYGTSPDELDKTITVPGAKSTTCIISGLTEGTYYFAVVAYTAAGTKSGVSNVATQSI